MESEYNNAIAGKLFQGADTPNMVTDTSPTHYARWKIEPISFIMHNDLPYAEGNVVKYILRYKYKDGIKDLDKAIRYIEMIKEKEYGFKQEKK